MHISPFKFPFSFCLEVKLPSWENEDKSFKLRLVKRGAGGTWVLDDWRRSTCFGLSTFWWFFSVGKISVYLVDLLVYGFFIHFLQLPSDNISKQSITIMKITQHHRSSKIFNCCRIKSKASSVSSTTGVTRPPIHTSFQLQQALCSVPNKQCVLRWTLFP